MFKKRFESIADFNKCFREHLDGFFEDHGYKRKREPRYRRNAVGLVYEIFFGVQKKEKLIWVGASASFLENNLRELMCAIIGRRIQVGCPIHFLRPGREYYLWNFSDKSIFRKALPEICFDFERYVFPYHQSIPNVGRFYDIILDDDSSQTLGLTPLEHDFFKIIVTALQEGDKSAVQLAKEMLDKHVDEKPPFKRDFEKALAFFEARASTP